MGDGYLQIAALAALEHAKAHGDVSLCQRLYQQVADTNKSNGEKLKSWFAWFGPLTKRGDTWCLRKSWQEDQFDLDGAARTPIGVRGNAINFQPVFSDATWPTCAEQLPNLSHIEILGILQACNEIILNGRRSIAKKVRATIEAEWQRRTDLGDFFVWPTSYIVPGDEQLTFMDAPPLGMLVALGYRVGKLRGRPEYIRLGILDYIYHAETLPPLNNRSYVEKWSIPESDKRLKTMAYSLALASWKAQSRVTQDLDLAISQWTNDLKYLEERYYQGRFDFSSAFKRFVSTPAWRS